MWSSLISILSVLMSIFKEKICSPVFAETTGDIIADMEQSSETYEQYELPEEVYEQNKIDSIDDIFTNDESESVLDDNSVSDDVFISSDETVDNTDSVDSTDNTETHEQESNAQENNAQENTEQEQTVSVDQLYEVNTYILGILIFFLIVVVCKLVYSFFNIFF